MQANDRQNAAQLRASAHATLLASLREHHGELLTGEALYSTLGFTSADAFHKARKRGQVHVGIFSMPNRRGNFAITREVVDWICRLRFENSSVPEEELPIE